MTKEAPLKLGKRQLKILRDMASYGNGQWPKHWKIYADDRLVMVSLHRHGLITSVGMYAALTRKGEKVLAEKGS